MPRGLENLRKRGGKPLPLGLGPDPAERERPELADPFADEAGDLFEPEEETPEKMADEGLPELAEEGAGVEVQLPDEEGPATQDPVALADLVLTARDLDTWPRSRLVEAVLTLAEALGTGSAVAEEEGY